jgi:hypothetical protein
MAGTCWGDTLGKHPRVLILQQSAVLPISALH